MKNFLWVGVGALVVTLVSGIAYYFWQPAAPPPVAATPPHPVVQAQQQPAPAPTTPPKPVLESPPSAPTPLPPLDRSDGFMMDALATLLHSKTLLHLFDSEAIISHLVATIDNLPRRVVPANALPIQTPAGKFVVTGDEDHWAISEANAARYAPYMRLVKALDAQQLVALYVHGYPLFQKAYEGLGYPGQYFNDRVMVVLDDLLAAPEPAVPVPLTRTKVFYLYADPDLEQRSAGQRQLMRMGPANERRVKQWLREIKAALLTHLKMPPAPTP